MKQSPALFLLLLSLGTSLFSMAKEARLMPEPADGKAVVTDYINAIGGMEAIKKINSLKDSGSFSVQGMALPMSQKFMAPNKTLQTVSMNGMSVAKTVFNGEKGYQEQMGNRVDMSATELADKKTQTSVIPQVDYLTNNSYKLSLQGSEKVNDKDAYKVLVTMPSGDVDTEYYDKATKLLVKQTLAKTVAGQSATVTYDYSDYRKVNDVLISYKQTLTVAAGPINQAIDILLSDITVNEGVTAADFE